MKHFKRSIVKTPNVDLEDVSLDCAHPGADLLKSPDPSPIVESGSDVEPITTTTAATTISNPLDLCNEITKIVPRNEFFVKVSRPSFSMTVVNPLSHLTERSGITSPFPLSPQTTPAASFTNDTSSTLVPGVHPISPLVDSDTAVMSASTATSKTDGPAAGSMNALLSPRVGLWRSSRSLTCTQNSFASTIEDEAGLVRINQYTILDDLGRGSYGSVKLVEDQNGQKFALKIISKKKLMKSAGFFKRPPPLRNSSASIVSNPDDPLSPFNTPPTPRRTNTNSTAVAQSTQPHPHPPNNDDSSTSSPPTMIRHHHHSTKNDSPSTPMLNRRNKQRMPPWQSTNTTNNISSDRINVPPPSQSNIKAPLQRIYQEIAIHKKLNHPNIVKMIEVIDEIQQPNLYMIFEYIEGGPVMDVGQSNPFSESEARKYIRDILQGLDYLHFNKIIHRDIKPSNLLLDANNTVKMIDFGVSCQFTGDDIFLQDSLGSPAFLAPEVVQNYHTKFTGKALDIWALGMTLYCFLYGRVAFDSHTKFDLYHMIATKPVKYPSEPVISEEALDLLSKMLEKDPKERIKLDQIKMHPWVNDQGRQPFEPLLNCQVPPIEVTHREVELCTVSTLRFETLVSAILIARRRSFRNPHKSCDESADTSSSAMMATADKTKSKSKVLPRNLLAVDS